MNKQIRFLLWTVGALVVWANRGKIITFLKQGPQQSIPS